MWKPQAGDWCVGWGNGADTVYPFIFKKTNRNIETDEVFATEDGNMLFSNYAKLQHPIEVLEPPEFFIKRGTELHNNYD